MISLNSYKQISKINLLLKSSLNKKIKLSIRILKIKLFQTLIIKLLIRMLNGKINYHCNKFMINN